MNASNTQIQKRHTFDDLVVRGGGTPDESKPVVFQQGNHQFKAPGIYASDPLSSKQVYSDEVDAMYEFVEQNEAFYAYGFNDVAVCLTRVMRRVDGGVARSVRQPMKLPSEMTVEVGYRNGKMQYETIPGDWMTIPGMDGQVRCRQTVNGPTIQFQFRRFAQDAINGFLGFIRDELRDASIYRGQVFDIYYNYIDVSGVDPERVVYSKNVGRLLDKWCLSPIRDAKVLEEAKLGRKVNVLLAGAPGTGKTLFKRLIEKIGTDYGRTCIEVPPGSSVGDFSRAVEIARQYMTPKSGAIILAEDIEKMSDEDRAMTLELLDGAKGKDDRLITVMTTNFPELLDPAMVRAERIHAVIDIPLPDLDVYTRLVQMKLGDQLAEDIDWEAAFQANEGYTPAWITGGMESVLRGVIARTGACEAVSVTTEDLVDAANDYRPQFRLQKAAAERVEPLPTFEKAFRHTVLQALAGGIDANVDYDAIEERTDTVLNARLDGAPITLETESGKEISGHVSTN